jgi:hypothetical protein
MSQTRRTILACGDFQEWYTAPGEIWIGVPFGGDWLLRCASRQAAAV